jgi:hypothetical protein
MEGTIGRNASFNLLMPAGLEFRVSLENLLNVP